MYFRRFRASHSRPDTFRMFITLAEAIEDTTPALESAIHEGTLEYQGNITTAMVPTKVLQKATDKCEEAPRLRKKMPPRDPLDEDDDG